MDTFGVIVTATTLGKGISKIGTNLNEIYGEQVPEYAKHLDIWAMSVTYSIAGLNDKHAKQFSTEIHGCAKQLEKLYHTLQKINPRSKSIFHTSQAKLRRTFNEHDIVKLRSKVDNYLDIIQQEKSCSH